MVVTAALGLADKARSEARLRVFFCNFCFTAEVVPWCGQDPNCGHPECAEALESCAACTGLMTGASTGRWAS